MREKEVIKLLKEHDIEWKEFEDWIRGQTVGIDSNKEIDYYEWDVQRFIEGCTKRWG